MYTCPGTEHLQGLVQNLLDKGPNFQVSRVPFISVETTTDFSSLFRRDDLLFYLPAVVIATA